MHVLVSRCTLILQFSKTPHQLLRDVFGRPLRGPRPFSQNAKMIFPRIEICRREIAHFVASIVSEAGDHCWDGSTKYLGKASQVQGCVSWDTAKAREPRQVLYRFLGFCPTFLLFPSCSVSLPLSPRLSSPLAPLKPSRLVLKHIRNVLAALWLLAEVS